MNISLFDYQQEAVDRLDTGKILCGSVGSGKSITALYYYFVKECKGEILNGRPVKMQRPKNLYIITTAKKRDSGEWHSESLNFLLSVGENKYGIDVSIDSWNNIGKYESCTECFFIFDEQHLLGYGQWSKSFLKIAKKNRWIMLSATPGDRWIDYLVVFIANGFFRNKTEFEVNHVVYSRFSSYPKIVDYINCDRLCGFRDQILVNMDYRPKTQKIHKFITVGYDKDKYYKIFNDLWDPYSEMPITSKAQYCLLQRRVLYEHYSRLEELDKILSVHPTAIIFYSYNLELDILKKHFMDIKMSFSEYNGAVHQRIPNNEKWVYLVQYSACEAWNCIKTNAMIFFSEQYSYRIKLQASGRIDRVNTPYSTLYYYTLVSKAPIDIAIRKAISQKKTFNESAFSEFKFA